MYSVELLKGFIPKTNLTIPIGRERNVERGPIAKGRIFQLYGQQTDGDYLWLGAVQEGTPTVVPRGPGFVSFHITKTVLRCFAKDSQVAWDTPMFNQPYKSNCRAILNLFKPGQMTDTLLIRSEEPFTWKKFLGL